MSQSFSIEKKWFLFFKKLISTKLLSVDEKIFSRKKLF